MSYRWCQERYGVDAVLSAAGSIEMLPRGATVVGLRALSLAGALIVTACAPQPKSSAVVDSVAVDSGADASGTLRVPANYRDTYQYLGTWAVADDKAAGSKEMHMVYASPGAAAGHRANGKFADGTTLVKEVFEASTEIGRAHV